MTVRRDNTILAALVVVCCCASTTSSLAQSPSDVDFPRDEMVAHAGQLLRRLREADRLAAAEPDSPAAVAALIQTGRAAAALDVAERIVRTRPDAVEQTLRELWRISSTGLNPREELLATRAEALRKEGQVVLASRSTGPSPRQLALSLLASQSGLPYAQRLAGYDRVIRDHAGTAVATLVEAWRISMLAGERPGSGGPVYAVQLQAAIESMERLLTRHDADQDAVDGALQAVLNVTLPSRSFDLKRTDDARVVAVLRAFVLRNSALLQHPRLASRFGYIAFTRLPDAIEVVDNARAAQRYVTELAALAPASIDPRLAEADAELDRVFDRLVEQRRYESEAAVKQTADVRGRLRVLVDQGTEPTRQRALALLASAEFRVGRVRQARALLDAYVAAYPDAAWTWIAALHAAQATQVVESADAAAERFAAVGRRHAAEASVPAIAAFYQARALDAGGRFPEALVAYQRTLRDWEGPYEQWDGLDWPAEFEMLGPVYALWPREIERGAVSRRVADLMEAATATEGPARAKAQWLLQHAQPVAARDTLRAAAARRPELSNDTAFATLKHHAEHDAAVALTAHGVPGGQQARSDLAALCDERFDPWVGLGCAALASLQAIDGREHNASATFTRALTAWQKMQAVAPLPDPAADSIEHDVLAIRDVLFQPRGGGIYGARRFATRDNGELPPFLLLPSTLTATFIDRQDNVIVRATRQPSGMTNAIFLDSVETRTMWETAVALSGCEGRQVARHHRMFRSVVGWGPAYCVSGGTWLTLPTVGRVNFANAKRTLADVPVGLGESGYVAVVEKVGGTWRFQRIKSSWVE